jgi:hypothetical protein
MPAIAEEVKRAAEMEAGDLAIEVVGKTIRIYEIVGGSKLKQIAYSDTFQRDRFIMFHEPQEEMTQAKDFTTARLYRKPEIARKLIAKYFPKYARAGARAHLYYSGSGPRGKSLASGEGYFSVLLSGPGESIDELKGIPKPKKFKVNKSSREFRMGQRAFKDGKPNAPALNKTLMQSFHGKTSDEMMQMMTDYAAGWHAANLAAPVPEGLDEAVRLTPAYKYKQVTKTDQQWRVTFETKGGDQVAVWIAAMPGFTLWSNPTEVSRTFMSDKGEERGLSGEFDARKVLNTVFGFVRDYLKEYYKKNPEGDVKVHFSAAGPKRAKIYKRYLNYLADKVFKDKFMDVAQRGAMHLVLMSDSEDSAAFLTEARKPKREYKVGDLVKMIGREMVGEVLRVKKGGDRSMPGSTQKLTIRWKGKFPSTNVRNNAQVEPAESADEARAFGLPGQFTGAKAHSWFMKGHAAGFTGQPKADLNKIKPPLSKKNRKAYEDGYARGKREKSKGESVNERYDPQAARDYVRDIKDRKAKAFAREYLKAIRGQRMPPDAKDFKITTQVAREVEQGFKRIGAPLAASVQKADPTFEQVARIVRRAKSGGFNPSRISLAEAKAVEFIFLLHHEDDDTYSVAHSVHDDPRLGYQELQTKLTQREAEKMVRKLKTRWKKAKVKRFLLTGYGHKRKWLPESNEEKAKRIKADVDAEVKNPKNIGLTLMQILRAMTKGVDEADISKEQVSKLHSRLQKAALKLVDQRGKTSPIGIQITKQIAQVFGALKAHYPVKGAEAVRLFLAATNKAGFLSSFAVIAGLVRKYKLKVGYGGRVDLDSIPESADEARTRVVVRKLKDEVNYRRAKEDKDGDERCGNCAFIEMPDECKRVRGKIEQDYICDLFKRGIAESAPPLRKGDADDIQDVATYAVISRIKMDMPSWSKAVSVLKRLSPKGWQKELRQYGNAEKAKVGDKVWKAAQQHWGRLAHSRISQIVDIAGVSEDLDEVMRGDELATHLKLKKKATTGLSGEATLKKAVTSPMGTTVEPGKVLVQTSTKKPTHVFVGDSEGNRAWFPIGKVQKYLIPLKEDLDEAGAQGKVQKDLLNFVEQLPPKSEFWLADVMKRQEFKRVHFKRLMSAAKALAKKNLIWYDGMSAVGPVKA